MSDTSDDNAMPPHRRPRVLPSRSALAPLAIVLAVSSAALAQPAITAGDLAAQTDAASALLREGKAAEAVQAYSGAIGATPVAPPGLLFNRACALFAANQLPEAEAELRAVLDKAPSDSLRSAAYYTLGLIEARHAEDKQDSALPEAIEHLRRAERSFRAASSATPDPSAAKNTDLVQRRLAALLDKQKQQDQQKEDESKDGKSKEAHSQKPDDKQQSKTREPSKSDGKGQNGSDQNLSDELKNLSQEQSQQAGQTEDLSKQGDQGASTEQQQQQQSDAAKKQNDLQKKTDAAKKDAQSKSEQATTQREKDALDKTQEALDKARADQKKAEQELTQGDTKSAQQHQKDAAEKLRDAAEQARSAESARQEDQARKDAERQAQEQAQQQAQSAQEADKNKQGKPYDATAAQILDQERRDKQMRDRLLRQRVRPVPVPKDW